MEILICTDGSETSLQSADLVSRLGLPASSHMVLLGVSEKKTDEQKLNNSMDQLEKKLGKNYPVKRKIRSGVPSEEILAEALEAHYDLVAVGGGGNQLGVLRPQLGSTTSKLARNLHTHFLVSRNIPERIGKILLCVSSDAPGSETISLGGAWIANTTALVGLLHVSPASMAATPRSARSDGSIYDEKINPEAVLEKASQQLRTAGVKNQIIPHLRQGLVVEEALKEIAEGGYQLLVVGAHYQPGQDRWQGTLLDDITDQLLNRTTCSVLII